MSTYERSIYNEGSAGRKEGLTNKNCPYGLMRAKLKHWWLAGWHDTDMSKRKSLWIK